MDKVGEEYHGIFCNFIDVLDKLYCNWNGTIFEAIDEHCWWDEGYFPKYWECDYYDNNDTKGKHEEF